MRNTKKSPLNLVFSPNTEHHYHGAMSYARKAMVYERRALSYERRA